MKSKFVIKDKYIFVLLFFMFLIAGSLFYDFILQKHLYVYYDIGGDTRQSYWPMYKFIVDSIKNGTLSTWSFQMGLGASTFTLYPFLFDPFILVMLLFPIKYLTYGMLMASLLKIFISGILFYKYLDLLPVKKFPAVIASLIWAFNGYMMLWGQHYWFATMMVLFTFIMYALELWIIGKRRYLFPISIAVMAINSPYFLFMISIFIFFYTWFRYVLLEKAINMRKVIAKLAHFFIAYFVGLGAGAVVFLPIASIILNSPRLTSDQVTWHMTSLATYKEYVSMFFRLFSNNTMGIGIPYFGSLNYYEGPMLSSSLLFILAFPQFILLRTKVKNKTIHFAGILLCLAALIFPFFSLFFSAFSHFTYRWDFLIVFLNVVTIAYILYLFAQMKRVSYFGLFISFLIVVIGWYYCYKLMMFHNMIPPSYLQTHYMQKMAFNIAIYLLLYTVIFLFLHKNNRIMWILLLCLVTVELIQLNYPAINERDTVPADVAAKKEGYFDYTNEALTFIKNKDNEFYRVDKNYVSYSSDDSLFQNYNGVKAYNSLNNPGYLAFLYKLDTGLTVSNSPLTNGYDQRPILRDLTGVKYVLSKNEDVPKEYKKLKFVGDVTVFENPDSLPLGFTYNSYITEKEFEKLMPFEKDNVLLNAAVVKQGSQLKKYAVPENEGREWYSLKDLKVNNGSFQNIKNKSNFEIFSKTGDPGVIINLPKTDNGWKIEFEVQGPGDTAGQIFWSSKGKAFNEIDSYSFTASEKPIKLAYEIDVKNMNQLRFDPGDAPGVYRIKNFKITQADVSKDQAAIKKLKSSQLKVENYSNSYIKGSISTEQKKMLFLSIPYDKGWKLKVDGSEVRTEQVNIGFIGAVIPKGHHVVELQYKQPMFSLGMIISFVCWLMIIWQAILIRKKAK